MHSTCNVSTYKEHGFGHKWESRLDQHITMKNQIDLTWRRMLDLQTYRICKCHIRRTKSFCNVLHYCLKHGGALGWKSCTGHRETKATKTQDRWCVPVIYIYCHQSVCGMWQVYTICKYQVHRTLLLLLRVTLLLEPWWCNWNRYESHVLIIRVRNENTRRVMFENVIIPTLILQLPYNIVIRELSGYGKCTLYPYYRDYLWIRLNNVCHCIICRIKNKIFRAFYSGQRYTWQQCTCQDCVDWKYRSADLVTVWISK